MFPMSRKMFRVEARTAMNSDYLVWTASPTGDVALKVTIEIPAAAARSNLPPD